MDDQTCVAYMVIQSSDYYYLVVELHYFNRSIILWLCYLKFYWKQVQEQMLVMQELLRQSGLNSDAITKAMPQLEQQNADKAS